MQRAGKCLGQLCLILLVVTVTATAVVAVDNQRPLCQRSFTGTDAATVVNGSASDRGSGQTGIVSVVLEGASVNIACQGCTASPLSPPANRVAFSLSLADPGTPAGQGTAIVTDGAGNICNVSVSYVPIAQGAVSNQPLVLDSARQVKLYLLSGNAPLAGVAVTAYTPPTADDVECLPACFEFQPGTQSLTVQSPAQGPAAFALDTPGNNNVRLLFRHPDECPFNDVSASVQGLVIDPRLKGNSGSGSGITLSTVEFATGRQVDGCTVSKKVDEDGDGFFFGGSTPVGSVDCNDVHPDINPAATEVCNGLDDDCDGGVDEGNLCGTIQITAEISTTAGDGSVKSLPLPGTEVRIYDTSPGTCAGALGNSPHNYCAIYGSGTFADPGCVSETSGLTDANGVVTFVVAPGSYIAIGKPPAPHEENKIGITLGGLSAGSFVAKTINLTLKGDGTEVPARNCR